MFSKACQYALKTMIYLGSTDDTTRLYGLREIAQAIDSPHAFTSKILQELVKSHLLDSTRGPNGGFKVNHRRPDITLAEVVIAVDGEVVFEHCILGLKECSETHPCPLHDKFDPIRVSLRTLFEQTTIHEEADKLLEEQFFLKV